MGLRSVQFVRGVSGVDCFLWYGLYSLCGECLACGLFCVVRSVQFVWRASRVWTVLCGYGLYSLCGECLVCGLFCVATVCTVCVGSVWCVDCSVWLRYVQFVWGVSGVWSGLYGYGLYILCEEYLVCGLFGVVMVCTVCVGSVWCVVWFVWLRSLQFVWGVSVLCTDWYGYVLYILCAIVWCVECCCGYGLYSLCGECLVCGLFGMAKFCTDSVRVSGVWTVWYGYGLYILCGECLVCDLFGVATFCTFCVGRMWCVDCLTKTSECRCS